MNNSLSVQEWLDGQMASFLATFKKPVVKEIFIENVREKVVRVCHIPASERRGNNPALQPEAKARIWP